MMVGSSQLAHLPNNRRVVYGCFCYFALGGLVCRIVYGCPSAKLSLTAVILQVSLTATGPYSGYGCLSASSLGWVLQGAVRPKICESLMWIGT